MADELKGQEALKAMPYFYTDLRSRIVPGCLTVMVLGILGFRPPKPYVEWFSHHDAITTIVVPLTILGFAYVIGDVIEVTTRSLWKKIDELVFPRAVKVLQETYKNFADPKDPKSYRFQLWHWMTIKVGKEYPEAFVHASRFQSEAKMFLNGSIPAAILVGCAINDRWHACSWHITAAFIAGIVALCCGWALLCSCQERRWLQSLASARQLNFTPEDPTDDRAKAVGA